MVVFDLIGRTVHNHLIICVLVYECRDVGREVGR